MQQQEIDALPNTPDDEMNSEVFARSTGIHWTETSIYGRPELVMEVGRLVADWLDRVPATCTCRAKKFGQTTKKCFDKTCRLRKHGVQCSMKCGENCQNRPFRSNQMVPQKFRVAHMHGKGHCLFTVNPIARGAFVTEYTGVVGICDEFDTLEKNWYLMQLVGSEICVNAQDYGSWSRFCANSHDPNLRVIEYVDDLKIRLLMIARRDIPAGAELTIDYGPNYGIENCLCMAPNCPDLPGKKPRQPTSESAPPSKQSTQPSKQSTQPSKQSTQPSQKPAKTGVKKNGQQRPASAPRGEDAGAVLESKQSKQTKSVSKPFLSLKTKTTATKSGSLCVNGKQAQPSTAMTARKTTPAFSSGGRMSSNKAEPMRADPDNLPATTVKQVPAAATTGAKTEAKTTTECKQDDEMTNMYDQKRQRSSTDSSDSTVIRPAGKKLKFSRRVDSSESDSQEQSDDESSTAECTDPSSTANDPPQGSKTRRSKYRCTKCSWSFKRQIDLDRHFDSVHLGLKPFACEFPGCTKTFSRMSGKNRHMKTHTNNRPFLCGIDGCKSSFNREDVLRVHQKNQHDFGSRQDEAETDEDTPVSGDDDTNNSSTPSTGKGSNDGTTSPKSKE